MQDANSSPLRPLIRPLAITFAVSLVFAIALPQFHALRPITSGSYFPAVFSGLGLVIAIFWTLATQVRIGDMLGGRAMAHWTIDGERWQAFAKRQRARAKRKRMLVLLMSPLLLLPVIMLSSEVETAFTVWLVLSIAGLLGLATYYATRPGQGAFAATTTRGEVMLTDSHAIVAGVLHQWSGLHRRVTGADVDASLGLIRVHVYAKAGTQSSNVVHEIPFPADAEEDARRIAGMLAL